MSSAPMYDQRDREALDQLREISTKKIRRLDDTAAALGHVYVFSINPLPFQWMGGGLGTFTVPGCAEGRAYSHPLRIAVQTPDGQPESISKIIEAAESGWRVAESLVGYGQHMPAQNDARKQGLFTCGAYTTIEQRGQRQKMLTSMVAGYLVTPEGRGARRIVERVVTDTAINWAVRHGDQREREEIGEDILAMRLPTEAEVAGANNAMNAWCLTLVQEADDYHRENEPKSITRLHRWAAERTNNLKRAWMEGGLVMDKCPVCQSPIYPDAAVCTGCSAVFNEEVVCKFKLKGFEHIWGGKPAVSALVPPPPPAGEGSSVSVDLGSWTKDRLIAYAKALYNVEIPTSTNKPEVLEIIQQHQSQAEAAQ